MAVDAYNAITGAPEFSDTGAPDIAVDPTAVGAYAADVGNYIVRADLAALEAYPYKRPGLQGYALDVDTTYVYSPTGWLTQVAPVVTYTPTITGLTVGNGALRAVYSKRDRIVDFFIELESGSTTSATGTVAFSLPVPIEYPAMHRHVGEGYFRYAGTAAGQWPVQPRLTGGQNVTATFLDTSGALLLAGGNISNTLPTAGAWGSSTFLPTLYLHGTYLAAS